MNKETEETEKEQKKRNREADLLLLELLEGYYAIRRNRGSI